MPEKELITHAPESVGILTYLWVLALGMWGGVIRFFRTKLDNGDWDWRSVKSWLELVLEMATSAFTGVVTFYLCTAAGLAPLWTAAFVAVAGHEGGRAIQVYLRIAERKL